MAHWMKPTGVPIQFTDGAILLPKSADCEADEDAANDPSTNWDMGDTNEPE